ncbi:MAG: OsmC family protein [Candidatus Lokiarchaeota archaeon]|nr:OsmC family protein [Candidatus Lokiarchaeota archaeon]
MLNRINVEGFKKVQDDYRKDRSKCKKTIELNGRWRLEADYGPQFEVKLKTERAGEITVQTDETIILGGGGTAVHPVHYCMAGFAGCFSAAFAKWAAMRGIELKRYDIKISADIDLTTGFGIEDGIDAVEDYKLEVTVESDANLDVLNEILEDTKNRCFCMYCIQTPITPKIELIKEFSEQEQEVIHFICPTCFKKSMIFLDDNTQVCQECGTTGFFVLNPVTQKVSLK